ncbi:hypothetical protein [Salinicola sp. NYA28a]
MNKIASRFWRALSLTSWVMASLSFVGTAGAAEEALPALSYDQTSERLLKGKRSFQDALPSQRA